MHTNIDLCSHTPGQERKSIVILSVLLFLNSQHTSIDINFILKLLKTKLNLLTDHTSSHDPQIMLRNNIIIVV